MPDQPCLGALRELSSGCCKGQTRLGKENATTPTVWSAARMEKGLAEVPVLLMSWYVNEIGTPASSGTEGAKFGNVETFL